MLLEQPDISKADITRSKKDVYALDSLPSWLVRGGLASWLLLGLIIVVGLVFFATSQVVEVFIGVFMALVLTFIL